jgi:hypothetical protein
MYETSPYIGQVFLRHWLPNTFILQHVKNSDNLAHNRKPIFTHTLTEQVKFCFSSYFSASLSTCVFWCIYCCNNLFWYSELYHRTICYVSADISQERKLWKM